MLPSGVVVILDESKFKALFEEGIQLTMPDSNSPRNSCLVIFIRRAATIFSENYEFT